VETFHKSGVALTVMGYAALVLAFLIGGAGLVVCVLKFCR